MMTNVVEREPQLVSFKLAVQEDKEIKNYHKNDVIAVSYKHGPNRRSHNVDDWKRVQRGELCLLNGFPCRITSTYKWPLGNGLYKRSVSGINLFDNKEHEETYWPNAATLIPIVTESATIEADDELHDQLELPTRVRWQDSSKNVAEVPADHFKLTMNIISSSTSANYEDDTNNGDDSVEQANQNESFILTKTIFLMHKTERCYYYFLGEKEASLLWEQRKNDFRVFVSVMKQQQQKTQQ